MIFIFGNSWEFTNSKLQPHLPEGIELMVTYVSHIVSGVVDRLNSRSNGKTNAEMHQALPC